VEFSPQSGRSVFQWPKWIYSIKVVTSGLLQGYVHVAGGCNLYPLGRPVFSLGLLVPGWTKRKRKITLTSLLQLK
jgi:hypothetical protein